MDTSRKQLRAGFDANPELYDFIRPRYPTQLLDVLIETADVQKEARILEIGLGTGQLTEPFAQRGFDIAAIELGKNLAEFSIKKLAKYGNIKIIHGAFEDVDLAPESFDLIYAATAFHWIDPGFKYKKTHYLLKASGHLAIVETHHVSDEQGDEFFFATQPLYQKYSPAKSNENYRLPKASDLTHEDFDKKYFSLERFEKFPFQVTYTAEEYCQLLSTFSDILKLPDHVREEFLSVLTELIRNRFDGLVTKYSVATLSVAKKI